jgi:ribosome-associated translation inhibitor RaiA
MPLIDIGGLKITPTFRARIARQLRRALASVRTSPVHVRVTFSDVNGPKGGLDVRCAIDVRIPQTAPWHVEEMHERDVTAFDRALATVARRIRERLGRRQQAARRPKKYYAARRLL